MTKTIEGKTEAKIELTAAGEAAKEKALYAASKKRPLRLNQMDGFYMPGHGDGDILKPDENGIAVTGGTTVELFEGTWDVRVLFKPDIDVEIVSKALRNMANWLEQDKNLFNKIWYSQRHYSEAKEDCFEFGGSFTTEPRDYKAFEQKTFYLINSPGDLLSRTQIKSEPIDDGLMTDDVKYFDKPF